ncbi:MAG: molybdenum cofactor biosynthesis protein MoaE [Thermoplasmata archaeon]
MLHRLSSRPLGLAGAYRALDSATAGAVVVFVGRVRPDSTGRGRVRALDYETDRNLALRSFGEIDRAALRRYPGVRLLLWHRTGRVPVGTIAVIVGAAAPHRAAAFAAARFAIERLKARSPIWKSDRVRSGRPRRRRRSRPAAPGGG